jgi:transposase
MSLAKDIFCDGTEHNKQTVAIIKALVEDGKSVREVAKEFDVSTSYIYQVKKKYKC